MTFFLIFWCILYIHLHSAFVCTTQVIVCGHWCVRVCLGGVCQWLGHQVTGVSEWSRCQVVGQWLWLRPSLKIAGA